MNLLHSPADVAAQTLVLIGAGSDPLGVLPWPVYAASEPPEPDECITVYDTSAKADSRTMRDGVQHYHAGLQVRVRALDHPTGLLKAESVRQLMDTAVSMLSVSLGSAVYRVACFARTQLIYVRKESGRSKRDIFTINCTAAVRRLQ